MLNEIRILMFKIFPARLSHLTANMPTFVIGSNEFKLIPINYNYGRTGKAV